MIQRYTQKPMEITICKIGAWFVFRSFDYTDSCWHAMAQNHKTGGNRMMDLMPVKKI